MIKLHENGTVRISGIKPELVFILRTIEQVFNKYKLDTVITGGTELHDKAGKLIHKIGSKHETGEAWDIRSKHIPKIHYDFLADELDTVMGVEFQLIRHSSHFHIELDYKGKL